MIKLQILNFEFWKLPNFEVQTYVTKFLIQIVLYWKFHLGFSERFKTKFQKLFFNSTRITFDLYLLNKSLKSIYYSERLTCPELSYASRPPIITTHKLPDSRGRKNVEISGTDWYGRCPMRLGTYVFYLLRNLWI